MAKERPPVNLERRSKLIRHLYLPLWLLITLFVLLLINAVFFITPPYWMTDPITYTLTRRVSASLITVFVAQMIASLILSLGAASASSTVPRGQGAEAAISLASLPRRSGFTLLTVILLRLLLACVAVIASANLFTSLSGISLRSAAAVYSHFASHPLMAVCLIVIAALWVFIEPLLVLRVSISAGLLVGAGAPDPDRPTVSMIGPLLLLVLSLITLLTTGILGASLYELLSDPPVFIHGGDPFIPDVFAAFTGIEGAIILRVYALAILGALALLAEPLITFILLRRAKRHLVTYVSPVNRWAETIKPLDKTAGLG